MNRLWRILLYGCIITLWLLVIAVMLEVWPRLRWQFTERCNPYLLSRTRKLPWPAPDAQLEAFAPFLLDEAARARYRGRGKSTEPLPPVSAQQEMSRRATFFFEYDDPDRYLFANVFGLHLFLLRDDGALLVSYSVPDYDGEAKLSDYVDVVDERLILEAMANQSDWQELRVPNLLVPKFHSQLLVPKFHLGTKRVHFVASADPEHPSPFGYCLALPASTEGSQDAWLMFTRREAVAHIPPDSLWELPFVTYKKHRERHDHISVLGITEDYYINNHGFRDWDIVLPKPEGVFRILCIGASTTEEGVTNELTYPAILEAMLNRHFQDNFVDVVNCGISGMNSMKHRMRLPDYLALDPDALVIYAAVNDICHQLLTQWVAEAGPRQQKLRRSRFITRYMNQLLLPTDAEMRQAIAAHIMPNLRYIVREAKKRGTATTICSFAAPIPEQLSPKEYAYYNYLTMKEWGGRYVTFDSYLRVLVLYNEALRQLCTEEEIPYVPVAENLRGDALFFGDICHLRSPGIQRKAEIIAEALIPQIIAAISTPP